MNDHDIDSQANRASRITGTIFGVLLLVALLIVGLAGIVLASKLLMWAVNL